MVSVPFALIESVLNLIFKIGLTVSFLYSQRRLLSQQLHNNEPSTIQRVLISKLQRRPIKCSVQRAVCPLHNTRDKSAQQVARRDESAVLFTTLQFQWSSSLSERLHFTIEHCSLTLNFCSFNFFSCRRLVGNLAT